ncbi:MAG TPA: glycosyltransferase 87 family protein [Solirubrobacteraceae bacterium]|nr:glycosyltransferase 87 family protein [Solirubrobacteraceae bacterium]
MRVRLGRNGTAPRPGDAAALVLRMRLSLVALCAVGVLLATATQCWASGQSVEKTGPRGYALSVERTLDQGGAVGVTLNNTVPAGRLHNPLEILAIAKANPKVAEYLREHPGAGEPGVALLGTEHWQVTYSEPGPGGKPTQVVYAVVDDATGAVTEAWTGYAAIWPMARGPKEGFGKNVTSWYIWIPLCLVFLAAFMDFRHPLRLQNLDLLALLGPSISVFFFNKARVDVSVPVLYPFLVYLLARVTWMTVHGRWPALKVNVGPAVLVVGIVALLAFRVSLDARESSVLDVGAASSIGAQLITEGKPLYDNFPAKTEHGDTYGPFMYEAYVPFTATLGGPNQQEGSSQTAAHAATIFFDLLSTFLLFMIGRRMRGPTLGLAMAYGWVSYPFTSYVVNVNSNDALPAALILAALLAAAYTNPLADVARGLSIGLAFLTKLFPAALVPMFAVAGLRGRRLRTQMVALVGVGLLVAVVVGALPALLHGPSLATVWERTVGFQQERDSPFSLWGLYNIRFMVKVVGVLAILFSLGLCFWTYRSGVAVLAAASAASVLAVEMALEYWIYFYIVWFFAPLLVALIAGNEPRRTTSGKREARSGAPARERAPAAVT